MTERERRFADTYIETGNAARAARESGYSEKTAKSIGAKLLKKDDIRVYVASRLDALEASRTATLAEVIQFLTAVMRGQVSDQFGLEASLQDRLKASDMLIKRFMVADDRNRGTMDKLDHLLSEFQRAVYGGEESD